MAFDRNRFRELGDNAHLRAMHDAESEEEKESTRLCNKATNWIKAGLGIPAVFGLVSGFVVGIYTTFTEDGSASKYKCNYFYDNVPITGCNITAVAYQAPPCSSIKCVHQLSYDVYCKVKCIDDDVALNLTSNAYNFATQHVNAEIFFNWRNYCIIPTSILLVGSVGLTLYQLYKIYKAYNQMVFPIHMLPPTNDSPRVLRSDGRELFSIFSEKREKARREVLGVIEEAHSLSYSIEIKEEFSELKVPTDNKLSKQMYQFIQELTPNKQLPHQYYQTLASGDFFRDFQSTFRDESNNFLNIPVCIPSIPNKSFDLKTVMMFELTANGCRIEPDTGTIFSLGELVPDKATAEGMKTTALAYGNIFEIVVEEPDEEVVTSSSSRLLSP